MVRLLLLTALLLSLCGARPAQAGAETWYTYISAAFGYSVHYPAALGAIDRAEYEKRDRTTAPSDVWFGPNFHIVTLIPPLPVAEAARWTEEWNGAPLGTTGRTLPIVQRLVRGRGADYLLVYAASDVNPGPEAARRAQFEQLAASFQMLDSRTHAASAVEAAAPLAAAFDDFSAKPSLNPRPPELAAYNARNTSLYEKLSLCYGKPVSWLQHTGEDWFRPGTSPVYAAAAGRVIYAHDTSYPGAVVVLEHRLPYVPAPARVPTGASAAWDGGRVLTVYSHLETWGLATLGSSVQKGQMVGRVLLQGANSHVHFELRREPRLSDRLTCPLSGASFLAGPGYTDTGVDPGFYGYLNPTAWIAAHRQAPAPALTRLVTTPVITAGAEGGSGRIAMPADGSVVAATAPLKGPDGAPAGRAVFTLERQVRTPQRVADGPGREGWDSFDPALSPDGNWLAFFSALPGASAGETTLVLLNRQTGEQTAVGSGLGGPPSLSADGLFVAHTAVLHGSGRRDVYVYDRLTGRAGAIPVGAGGGDSQSPVISGDGRFVAFVSESAGLVPGDLNGQPDVFVHDRQSGRTERVSTGPGGLEWQGELRRPSISADGRYVAFESRADTFGSGNTFWNVYVHDRLTGLTGRITVSPSGLEADGDSWGAQVSDDGGRVLFSSNAGNLTAAGAEPGVFLHDRTLGQTARLGESGIGMVFAADGSAAAMWVKGVGGADLMAWGWE